MSAPTATIRRTAGVLAAVDTRVHEFALRHSVSLLRIALGFVFILFGFLKFFPGLSPAQELATWTMEQLTFGLVPAAIALKAVAVVEFGVGLCLFANRFMRVAVWFLAFEMLAILSPLVLLTGDLFSGPHHLPSLIGQYILKDFVLLAGVLVLFATQRGARITPLAEQVAVEPSATPHPMPYGARGSRQPANRDERLSGRGYRPAGGRMLGAPTYVAMRGDHRR